MNVSTISQLDFSNKSFKAKLSTYPKTISNKVVYEKFEKETVSYPNLTLMQDDISYFGDDFFYLLEKGNVLACDSYSFTNNHPKTIEETVERFVVIFNKLLKKSLKEGSCK